jgi:hypothetical protein
MYLRMSCPWLDLWDFFYIAPSGVIPIWKMELHHFIAEHAGAKIYYHREYPRPEITAERADKMRGAKTLARLKDLPTQHGSEAKNEGQPYASSPASTGR